MAVWLAKIGVQTGDSSERAGYLEEFSGDLVVMRCPTCEAVLFGGAEPNCDVVKVVR